MIQFSSTKDTSTSYQGLAALETMPGPIGIKAQESPVEGGSGSKILEANFGATVVAETGSLPYRNEAVPFNRCCSSCETILCVCAAEKQRRVCEVAGGPQYNRNSIDQGIWTISTVLVCLQLYLKRGPHQLQYMYIYIIIYISYYTRWFQTTNQWWLEESTTMDPHLARLRASPVQLNSNQLLGKTHQFKQHSH